MRHLVVKLCIKLNYFSSLYSCQVNNTVGAGIPCEIEVQGIGLLKNIQGANIIIIVAVIAAGIVALLIVAVVVILICRRNKKPTDKCKYFYP